MNILEYQPIIINQIYFKNCSTWNNLINLTNLVKIIFTIFGFQNNFWLLLKQLIIVPRGTIYIKNTIIMKIILSPAKRLNEKLGDIPYKGAIPKLINDSKCLVEILKNYSKSDISVLMNLSDKLSELNFNRFQYWKKEKINTEGKPNIFMFEGDAYKGLDIKSFSNNEVELLNSKLYILSGLYGILKPLDLILPYRLEMGTKLKNTKGKNLYDFWGNALTDYLNAELKNETLINLASKEYSSVIDFSKLKADVIQIDFLQEKDNTYKNISIFSKRARGLMTAFIIKNKLEKIEDLKAFDYEKYFYNNNLSKENHLVFTR